MAQEKILVVWSNYHKGLADQQLESCLKLLRKSDYEFRVEEVKAGTYELPVVMQYFQKHDPYDGYIPLSLLLKGGTDHYEFIWEHVKECFIQFAMQGVLLGNGIISAPTKELLMSRLESGERSLEAFNAVDYLIKFKKGIERG